VNRAVVFEGVVAFESSFRTAIPGANDFEGVAIMPADEKTLSIQSEPGSPARKTMAVTAVKATCHRECVDLVKIQSQSLLTRGIGTG
jgi:hypothetical protein